MGILGGVGDDVTVSIAAEVLNWNDTLWIHKLETRSATVCEV